MTDKARSDSADLPSLEAIGLDAFAPFLINRVSASYNLLVQDMLTGYGLTTPKMRALAVLATSGGLTVNELAWLAVFEQSTMSRTLDALEAQGYLRRQQRAGDMRVRELHITDEGRAVYDSFWPRLHALSESIFTGIDASDRERFVTLLHHVLANLQAPAADG